MKKKIILNDDLYHRIAIILIVIFVIIVPVLYTELIKNN